jgi:phospholipid/cholesterol/gamma-HCH transport system substrate-binding protein
MSQKANATSIGLFLIIGLAVGLAGVLTFSSRSLFHPRQKQILYFDASLQGLNAGAPVKFRGVTIGSVVELLIRHNQASNDFAMPVLIAIDKKLAQSKSDEVLQIGDQARLDYLVEHGFRARLELESLVTAVLYVDLAIVTNAPTPVLHQLSADYQEIPTVPSEVQQLLSNLAHLDVNRLSENVNRVLTRLDSSLAQLTVAEINTGITNLLVSANRLVTSPDLTNSLASLRQTLDRASTLVKHVDNCVDPVADGLTNTLSEARKTLADLQVGIRNISDLLGPDSALRPDLTQALEDLSNACQSLAELAQFLKRNPNALLTGVKRSKEMQ